MADDKQDPGPEAAGQTVVEQAAPPDGGKGKSANGTGQFTDAAGSFGSAATTWTTPSADPLVSASFLLGWRVGLALSWAADGKREPWPDDDPGLAEDERWSVLTGQIENAAKKLIGHEISAALPAEPDRDAATAVKAVRRELLRELYVQDHFRGMAFTLGGQLEALCIGSDREALARGIPDVSKPLLALATSLPPNAAHSVLNSLALWSEQLKAHGRQFAPEHIRRQGGIWRSILAGDVAARDLLHLSDYVGTAEEVVARLHEFALKALRRHLLIPAVLALVLLAGGILLLLFSDKVAAGATGVVAALGLSWKGLGQYLGNAAAKGEQALWDAQMDWTIAYRATISVRKPSAVTKGERAKANWARMRHAGDPSDRRRTTHYYVWQKWLLSWPDFELDR
jgi:hypothetical protein